MILWNNLFFSISVSNMAHHSNQILRTLNDQIQNLTPLRESFKRLQIYYSKITADFDELIKYGKHSEAQMMSQLRYLEEVHRELEYQFSVCGQQLRETESQQASLLLQRNQQLAQSQALKSRLELQASQKAAFEAKRKDLLEYSSKIQFNISKYKQLIHNLELMIKSKQYENLDIQREIKKLQLINSKISHLNKESEQSITMTQQKNQRIVEQLHQLEEKLDTYQRLIEAKEKLNKENVQILISKTEELQQIRNRKQYTQKLIESQIHSQKELLRSYGQVDSVLNIKRQKLLHLQQQNHQYEAAIEEQASSKRRNKQELDRLSNYLQSLVQANEILFRQLQRSCTLDREVQVLLSEKLQKLYKVNQKITEHQILTKFDVNMLHHKTLSKNTNTSSASLLKQELLSRTKQSSVLTPSAKKSLEIDIEQRLSRVRDQQMSSTWGSFTKENYRHDL